MERSPLSAESTQNNYTIMIENNLEYATVSLRVIFHRQVVFRKLQKMNLNVMHKKTAILNIAKLNVLPAI